MRLVILSDIHGNWPALEAVARAEKRIDGFICLGDLVNYGPHPVPCVEWAQVHVPPGNIVQGNHDRALGFNEDPRCSQPYKRMAAAMQQFTAGQLGLPAKAYLRGLPTLGFQELDGASVAFCHAAPSDPLYGYIPETDAARWDEETVVARRPDFLFVGHTHVPFIHRFRETTVLNPGSVGQPKDGNRRAAYAVWDNGSVELRRATYEVGSVVADLNGCAPEPIVRQLGGILLAGGNP